MKPSRNLVQWTAVAVAALCVVLVPCPGWAALVAGWALAATLGAPARAPGAARHLLALSIVALGCGIDLAEVLRAGREAFAVSMATLALTFWIGGRLAPRLHLPPNAALLVTAGTAVCGGSAIAAVAPLIRARTSELGAAVGVVFALNAAALLVFPYVGSTLGLDATAFGTWCALAIHDTSSVVGAAATHSPEALDLATVQKLTRVLWIVPVGFLVARRRSGEVQGARRMPAVPWFLVAFVAASAAVTAFPAARPVGDALAGWGRAGTGLALLAVGLGMHGTVGRNSGGRLLLFGLVLWATLAAAALGYATLLTAEDDAPAGAALA